MALRPPWNREGGVSALFGRLKKMQCFSGAFEKQLGIQMLRTVCPFDERDPDMFWFNVCWSRTLCSTELIEHFITGMRFPLTVKILKPSFGLALLGTCRTGAPTPNVRMFLADMIEEPTITGKESTILIPMCKSGHWGVVVVKSNPDHTAGTIFWRLKELRSISMQLTSK